MVGVRVDSTIGVHVKLLATFVRLRFQNSIQRCCCALSDFSAHGKATIIGQHNIVPILIHQVHRKPAVKPTGRLKSINFGPIANHRNSGKHQHAFYFFHRNLQTHSLPWTKSPHDRSPIAILVDPRLVFHRINKIKRSALRIDFIGQMPNLETLIQVWPVLWNVINKLDPNAPPFFHHLFKDPSLTLKSVTANKQMLMICLLYTSPSPRDGLLSRMPSSA